MTREQCLEFLSEWSSKALGNGRFAPYRGDKEVVLKAVSMDGLNLQYASEELRADKEVVLKAVKENGCALRYASKGLRGDRAVVLKAVVESNALRYASKALRDDFEVALAAAEDGVNIGFISERIFEDRESVLKIARVNGYVLKFALKFRADREIAIESVLSNHSALNFIDVGFANDAGFIAELLSRFIENDSVEGRLNSLQQFASKKIARCHSVGGGGVSIEQKAKNWLEVLREQLSVEQKSGLDMVLANKVKNVGGKSGTLKI